LPPAIIVIFNSLREAPRSARNDIGSTINKNLSLFIMYCTVWGAEMQGGSCEQIVHNWGERWERRQGRSKRPERVAAVGGRRRRSRRGAHRAPQQDKVGFTPQSPVATAPLKGSLWGTDFDPPGLRPPVEMTGEGRGILHSPFSSLNYGRFWGKWVVLCLKLLPK